MNLSIKYFVNDELNQLEGDLDRNLSFQDSNLGVFCDFNQDYLKVKVYPNCEIKIEEIKVNYPCSFNDDDYIFFNGYSDWTYSYESGLKTINYGINKIPFKKAILNKYHFDRYGDYNFAEYPCKNGYNHGWTYLYIRNNDDYKFYGSLNEDFAFTRFVFDKNYGLSFIPDLNGYTTSDSFTAINICLLNGKEDEVFDKYFELLNIDKPTCDPLRGYTSWYNHYQNINENIILSDLDGLDYLDDDANMFQIDDGYETYVGDWLEVDSNKFPNGLKPIVESIHEKGYKAGLWLAPFSGENKSKLFNEHKDWFVKDKSGDPCYCGSNWSGFYGLDIYKVEVRQYLKKVFDTIFNDWGFDLVKLDFLYSCCVYSRNDKPRGQVMADGMRFLRELCKDKLILGCGVPCASAFGRADYCRVGPDVSLDYDDKFYMHFMHNERNSTWHTMLTSIFRRQLDNRAFLNDPDVFILRDDNTKLTDEQKEQLAFVNGLFGSVLFTSDDFSKYNDEQKELYKKVINLKGKCVSVDILDNKVKIVYKYNDVLEELYIDIA